MSLPPLIPPPPAISLYVNREKSRKIVPTHCQLRVEFWPFEDMISEVQHVVKRKLIPRFGEELNKKLVVSYYSRIPSMLQEGPMCGLVSLFLAAKCLKLNGELDDIFRVAKENNWTAQGEMFSASWLSQLASICFDCRAVVVEDGLEESLSLIESHLTKGFPILVPYDSGGNHEPCLKKGHKAHWAVLTGIVLVYRDDQFFSAIKDNIGTFKQDEELPFLIHAETQKIPIKRLEEYQKCSPDIYVYAKHGKSKYLDLWSLKELTASNANLVEISPDILREKDNFVLPPWEGIKAGLNKKAIVISPN